MKILMVCLGNICRSPLAHGILNHLATEKGLDWQIDSAGTGDWHTGQAPDKRAIAVAAEYGVDIAHQKAQWFEPHLFEKYDHILVMDKNNLKDVLAQTKSDDDRKKVRLFLTEGEVPDPYFDNNLFDPVYKLIEKRCQSLIRELS